MAIQTPLRLSEAQQLYDGLNDLLLSAALSAFYDHQKNVFTQELLSAVRKSVRDTMKEARLAGKIEAYEDSLQDLRRFAEEQMRDASQ